MTSKKKSLKSKISKPKFNPKTGNMEVNLSSEALFVMEENIMFVQMMRQEILNFNKKMNKLIRLHKKKLKEIL